MLEKYKLIMYIVVSVDPCMTDATLPIKLSGPYLASMSFSITNELDPDIGLRRASGNTSTGKFILLSASLNMLLISNIILLFVSIVIAITIANIVGNRFIDTFSPSFTPNRKVSNISTFL